MNYILVKPIKHLYDIGTLIRYDGVNYVDVENETEIPKLLKRKYKSCIKLLDKSELAFYRNFPKYNRVNLWKQSHYKCISDLNIGDKCFVTIENKKYYSEIFEKYERNQTFMVKYDRNEETLVDYYNTEIFNQKIVKYMILTKDFGQFSSGSRFIKHEKLLLTYPYYEIVDNENLKRKLKPTKNPNDGYKSKTLNLSAANKSSMPIHNNSYTMSTKPKKYLIIDYMHIMNSVLVESNSIEVNWVGCLMCSIVWLSQEQQFCCVKWRGTVNNEMCIGVELLSDIKNGTNGSFDGQLLFDCKEKCGVLIPEDKLAFICLRDGHKSNDNFTFNHDIIDNLKYNDICCLENIRMPTLETGDKCLIMNQNNKPTITGVFICKSVLNSKLNISILSLQSSIYDIEYTINSLPFITEYNQLIFTQNLDIELDDLGVIISKKYNLILYNNIYNKQLTNEILINKSIFINDAVNFVIVLSENKIDNKICFNCQITDENQVVVIPKKYLPSCCLLNGEHRKFERDQDDWINTSSICCYKVLEQFPANTSDIEVNCGLEITRNKSQSSRNHKALCKWIGIINGLNCVGLEMVYSSSNFYPYCSITPLNIEQWKSNFGRLLELKEVQHDYEENHVHLLKDGVINVAKVWRYKTKINDGFSVKLGDAVKIQVGPDSVNGRIQWIGKINKQRCVGIETCFSHPLGNNGVIKGEKLINCNEKHALFVLANNLKKEYCQPVTQNGIIQECCIENSMDRLSKKWSIGNIVKLSNNAKLIGRIKSFHFINNHKCLLITRLDIWANGIDCYIFDDDKVIKTDLKGHSKKFKSVSILIPNSIESIEPSSLENNYRIGEAVEFSGNSNESKFSGSVVGCYMINLGEFAIVRLDDSQDKSTNQNYLPDTFVELLKLPPQFTYLVVQNNSLRLRNINQKMVALEDDIIKLVNAPIPDTIFIQLLENNIKVDNRHLVHKLIVNTDRTFHFLDYINVYYQLSENGIYYIDCLIKILKSTRVCDDCNEKMMEFMYKILMDNNLSIINNEILRILIKISKNLNNILVKDGEILLTRLLKQIEISSDSIKELLEFSKTIENDHDCKFDFNTLNNQHENALMVVCKYRRDGNLFQYLLQNGGDISLKNYRILDILRQMEEEHNISSSHKPENKQILRIYSLINQQIIGHIGKSGVPSKCKSSPGQLELIAPKLPTDDTFNLCSICFERCLEVVYSCGHMSCRVCAREMALCPFCRLEIGQVKPVFFN